MKTLQSIIEDSKGNVIGASTSAGDVMLAEADRFPRSELASKARLLATKHEIEIPAEILPILRP
jgi:hypothetical protein